MEQVLQDIIRAQLDEEKKLGEQARVMITAACRSDEALAAALVGEANPLGDSKPNSDRRWSTPRASSVHTGRGIPRGRAGSDLGDLARPGPDSGSGSKWER